MAEILGSTEELVPRTDIDNMAYPGGQGGEVDAKYSLVPSSDVIEPIGGLISDMGPTIPDQDVVTITDRHPVDQWGEGDVKYTLDPITSVPLNNDGSTVQISDLKEPLDGF